jgi:hypothetical protein
MAVARPAPTTNGAAASASPELLASVEALLPVRVGDRVAGLGGLAGEVRDLLAQVSVIEWMPMSDADKVRVVGDRLRVDREYADRVAGEGSVERAALWLALYVVHEATHLPQGLSDKRDIADLRACGGEDTLLQIDLEADHSAVEYIAAAAGRTRLDVEHEALVMLGHFPVGREHGPAGVARKTRRAVALAVDLVVRARGLLRPHETYASLQWSRAGNFATVYAHGRSTRRVLTFEITQDDAATLDGAACPSARPTALCRRLARRIDAAVRGAIGQGTLR